MKDLYKTLGVAENADDATIKKAYRKLAKELHPDVTGNDKKKTERFKEINEAYSVLGDAQKRKEYDRLKHAPVRPDGMPEGFDADAFAQTFGRRADVGRRRRDQRRLRHERHLRQPVRGRRARAAAAGSTRAAGPGPRTNRGPDIGRPNGITLCRGRPGRQAVGS